MIVKQGKHFTTAKIFKKVCKTLFVTVTILSPHLSLNDFCFKIIVDTAKFLETFHMTKVTFLHHFCRWALTFSYSNIWAHCYFALLTWRYVITSTLKRHWHYHYGKLCKGTHRAYSGEQRISTRGSSRSTRPALPHERVALRVTPRYASRRASAHKRVIFSTVVPFLDLFTNERLMPAFFTLYYAVVPSFRK